MRRIVAKGLLSPVPYFGYGRRWPRETPTEVEVSDEQAQVMLDDPNLVAVEIPGAPQDAPSLPALADLPAIAPLAPGRARKREA